MQVLWLGELAPIFLVSFEGDAHLVELHDGGVGADGVSRPLRAYADEELGGATLRALVVVVFEQRTYAFIRDFVVSHVVVHLLVGGHHVGDPTRPANFKFRLLCVFAVLH